MQDDILLLQQEEYEYRKQQLQDMMTQFINAYGRDKAIVVAGMLSKATMEKVVTTNPMRTIKQAYDGMKSPKQEVIF